MQIRGSFTETLRSLILVYHFCAENSSGLANNRTIPTARKALLWLDVRFYNISIQVTLIYNALYFKDAQIRLNSHLPVHMAWLTLNHQSKDRHAGS
ncbi:hypothetical protein VTL71DRAFT_5549, partial [Oculimacula yallundae]